MRSLPVVLARASVSVILAGAAVFSGASYGSTVEAASPAAGACGLGQPVFCDTFDAPYTSGVKGRTGQLDPSRWTVARLTQLVNPAQGQLNEFLPSAAVRCKTGTITVVPPNDYFLCGVESGESEHFMEAFDDGGGYVWNDAMALQPFDFAGRTGTIAFDVDAKTGDAHANWVEVWITQEPSPGVHSGTPGSNAYSRNGIGFRFAASCDSPEQLMRVYSVDFQRNFTDDERLDHVTDFPCVQTMDDMKNHIEIRINQSSFEVWASDASMTNPVGTNFRRIDHMTMPAPLGFTRGYVHLQHAQYNAGKEGLPSANTYHWDNVGFDGPMLAPMVAYNVPDALTPGRDAGSVNLAYNVTPQGMSSSSAPVNSFSLPNVNLTGASGGWLSLNGEWQTNIPIKYRFNSSAWRSFAPAWAFSAGLWHTLSIPVALADLVSGNNTLQLGVDSSSLVVANISLELVGAGSAQTGPPTATPVATSTNTAAPTSTNTPAPTITNTPVAGATSTPVPTATNIPVQPPQPSPASVSNPAFVQVNSTTPQSPQSRVALPFRLAQTAGNANVAIVGWNDDVANITSVKDGAGNTYRVAAATRRGSGMSQAIYYAANVKAAAAATNTLTVTFDRAAIYVDVRALEYRGLDRINPFDVTASGASWTGSASTGSATTHSATELIVGAGMTSGAFTGPGNSFVNRVITSPDADIAEDRVVTSTGSYSASAPVGSAWLMQMATFRAAAQ